MTHTSGQIPDSGNDSKSQLTHMRLNIDRCIKMIPSWQCFPDAIYSNGEIYREHQVLFNL